MRFGLHFAKNMGMPPFVCSGGVLHFFFFFLAVAALPLGATLATRSRLDGTHSHKVVKLRNHISVLQTACPLRASLGGCMPSLRYVKMKYWVYFSSCVWPILPCLRNYQTKIIDRGQ